MNKLKVGLIQERWHPNLDEHCAILKAHIKSCALQGAKLVCLQELTLSPYFCTSPNANPNLYSENIFNGQTFNFLSACAKENSVCITGSLFEAPCYNTAIAVNHLGELIGYTRKQHIPSGDGYHEDKYFKPGDSDYPIHNILDIKVALPTCYDQWFPELSRIYSLKGAELIIYPTAIGSEPTAKNIDTKPMWQKVMQAQAIITNTFIIAINRIGHEDGVDFYGSSFISSPQGEILAEAPRFDPAVIVLEIDFSKRDLWGRLFPLNSQREPSTYSSLSK